MTSELTGRIRQLELRARKNVSHFGAGAYRSAFKGQGLEFQEIREYTPGDDVRSIDWNVTARHGRPYVKRFAQEREQTIMLLVDASASTEFRTKRDVIAELAVTLGYAAIGNADRLGMILFGQEVEHFVAPAAGMNQAFRLMRDLSEFKPSAKGTSLVAPLRFLDRVVPRRAFVILISDFLASDASAQLRVSGKRHNLVALSVSDPLEAELPDGGLVEVQDPESGARMLLDCTDPKFRREFANHARKRASSLDEAMRAADVDHFRVVAGSDYFPSLLRFLEGHAARR